MTDPVDIAHDALERLASRQRYDERNRLALLIVHGVMGVAVGALILIDSPPAAWVDWVGTGREAWLAGPALAGGATLLAGLAAGRHLILEAAGMAGILAWDALMVATFVKGDGPAYPTALYLGLAALMTIHVVTLCLYLWTPRAVRD